jgi:hypothetical protein
MKANALGWLEVVAWDRGRGILIFWINGELHNLEKIIIVALTARELNFDEFKLGGGGCIRSTQ